MPYPDGAIKDCIRVYESVDGLKIPIYNIAWSLIEKNDLCEIQYAYDLDRDEYEAKALLVKRYPVNPAGDVELVGIIFPANYEI